MGVKIVEILLLLGFVGLLVKSTEVLIGALKHLAKIGGVDQFGITAFLLALATSLPELVVGIVAALEGEAAIALGNVLGSNIADLSLVIGGAAVLGAGIKVKGDFLKRDLLLSFLAGSLPLLLLVDGRLTRWDGVVLLVVYMVFVMTVLREKSRKAAEEIEKPVFRRLFYALRKNHGENDVVRFVGGVGLLLVSSHMVVQLAERVAVGLGVPLLLVGLILVALGTSLPELAFEVKAVRRGEVGMVFGDLLGSVVANSTLIMGVVATMSPFKLDGGLRPYLLGTLGFGGLFLLFWMFTATKQKLERWEGLMLIGGYVGFVLIEMMK